jgi:hypothetical protein
MSDDKPRRVQVKKVETAGDCQKIRSSRLLWLVTIDGCSGILGLT